MKCESRPLTTTFISYKMSLSNSLCIFKVLWELYTQRYQTKKLIPVAFMTEKYLNVWGNVTSCRLWWPATYGNHRLKHFKSVILLLGQGGQFSEWLLTIIVVVCFFIVFIFFLKIVFHPKYPVPCGAKWFKIFTFCPG